MICCCKLIWWRARGLGGWVIIYCARGKPFNWLLKVIWAEQTEQKGCGAAHAFIMDRLVDISDNVLRRRTIGARFGSKGGRFVRIGEELYAEGSVPLLEDTFVNPTYTSIEDIVHLNAQPDYIEHSEVLDEIELNANFLVISLSMFILKFNQFGKIFLCRQWRISLYLVCLIFFVFCR